MDIQSTRLTQSQHEAKSTAIAFLTQRKGAAAFTAGNVAPQSIANNNVCGVGIGGKVTQGVISDEVAIRVYVRDKIPRHQLTRETIVPSNFDGVATDIIEVREIIAGKNMKTWQRYGKHRPAYGGISVGHGDITAGTLGCLVEREGIKYILSNNHVLADINKAKINDPILQPGPMDGGTYPDDCIARLSEFKHIEFGPEGNKIDAAIACVGCSSSPSPEEQDRVRRELLVVGRPLKPLKKPAQLYQSVRKYGRTTGHTVGVITELSADIWVRAGRQRAFFKDQIGISGVGNDPFSSGGDSGSLIVDAVTRRALALLFAGGKGMTFANAIQDVLDYFNVTIA